MKNLLLILFFTFLLISCKNETKIDKSNDNATIINPNFDIVNLEDYGDPAILSFNAERANVISDSLGQRIIFKGLSTLGTITANVHTHNKRVFAAFPISEFAESWNTCNTMKLQNGLFHSDGFNAIMTFSSGPSGLIEDEHLSVPPLITQTDTVNKTKGMEEGALNLMLLNAKGNSETMSFEIKGRVLSDGQYLQVQVSTECILLQ